MKRNSIVISLFIYFLFFPPLFFAQKNKALIDSLEQLALTQKDSDLVKTYNELTWQYRSVAAEKAIDYGNKAIELGKKVKFEKGVAQAYNDLGIVYYDKQDYAMSLELYKKAMAIRKKNKDLKGVAALHNKIGIVYQTKGDYAIALENQQKALDLFEQVKYDLGVSYSLNNIAILNYNIGNMDEALKYHLKSIELKKKIKDYYGLSGSYVNVANIYFKRKDYNQAIDYNLMALELCRIIGDKEYLSATLNNLSSNYLLVNDNTKALKCAEESYQLRKALNDKKSMISCLVNMGKIYLNKKELDLAYLKLSEALKLSKEFEVLPELPALYGTVAEYYEHKKDFANALTFQRLQSDARDSLLSEDLNSKITEMNTRYETEKKEKLLVENKFELKDKELQIGKARSRFNYSVAAFVIMLLLFFIFYNRYRLKQKIIFNQEMLHQQELRTKLIIEAEEHERTRIARELHDGVGQQLAATKLTMSNLQSTLLAEKNQNIKLMNSAIELLDDSVKEVRTVSHSMMPNALIKSGLEKAIYEFAERISLSSTLKINCDIHLLNERLNSTLESIIYRLIQEMTTNIIKHAKATNVTLQLIEHDNELTVLVEDDGVGFDTEQVGENGIGLQNLKTRVAFLKGAIHFDSSIGKGTTITIDVPLV